MRYDIIGDVHGHATALRKLLLMMGYSIRNNAFFHPERRAIFVGDLVDRGAEVNETLAIVRNMCDAGNALAVMGNHEYNTLCYLTKNKKGEYLRAHSEKNLRQIKDTLAAFESNKSEAASHIKWIKSLPLFLEMDDFRVVHAFWSQREVDYVRSKLGRECIMDDDFFQKSAIKGSDEYTAIELLLKGKEIILPKGCTLADNEATMRDTIRIRWWEQFKTLPTYAQISVHFKDKLPDLLIDKNEFDTIDFYSNEERPVFFGHYWMKGIPTLCSNNAACVDYSIAKNSKLAAYRWNGEQQLKASSFIWVEG